MIQERGYLGERLLEYGARIIKLVESLPNTLVGRRVADQLLRSGTSAGANYEEARGAESKDDFVHKLQIALKELGVQLLASLARQVGEDLGRAYEGPA